jgi:hypothetical protein
MLTTYAAWTERSVETDVAAIRRAMNTSAYSTRNPPVRHSELGNGIGNSRRQSRRTTGRGRQRAVIETATPAADLAIGLPMATRWTDGITIQYKDLDWRSGRDSNPRYSLYNQ